MRYIYVHCVYTVFTRTLYKHKTDRAAVTDHQCIVYKLRGQGQWGATECRAPLSAVYTACPLTVGCCRSVCLVFVSSSREHRINAMHLPIHNHCCLLTAVICPLWNLKWVEVVILVWQTVDYLGQDLTVILSAFGECWGKMLLFAMHVNNLTLINL